MEKDENKRLLNKITLITGGGSGIGRATSLRFAKEGASVIVVDINIEGAEETVNMIKKTINSQAVAISCDIRIKDEIRAMVNQAYKEFPRIDILFNNAGIGTTSYGKLINITESIWDEVMNVNLRGTWLVTKYLAKKMKKQEPIGELRGKIINNSSVVGKAPMSPLGAYSISKAGVIAMTKVFAFELAPFKITVNAICPGFILTEIYLNDEKLVNVIVDKWGKPIPLERIGYADDIANALFFLASDDSNYMTGQSISVDGGAFPF